MTPTVNAKISSKDLWVSLVLAVCVVNNPQLQPVIGKYYLVNYSYTHVCVF